MNGNGNTIFWNAYGSLFIRPSRTFRLLTKEPASLRWAAMAVCIPAVLYTLVYLFLILGDGRPFKPWLNIPDDMYYRYNVFFCAPSMFLGWILASGVVQLLSRTLSGTGTFESTLVVIGFGIGVANWSTGLHDIVTSFLGAIQVINQQAYEVLLNTPTIWRAMLWALMGAYVVWFIALFTKGIRVVHRINPARAFLIGLTGFLVYQLFFLIFNR